MGNRMLNKLDSQMPMMVHIYISIDTQVFMYRLLMQREHIRSMKRFQISLYNAKGNRKDE